MVDRQFWFRDRAKSNAQLHHDCFIENLVFDDQMYCRRYRIRQQLFLRLVDAPSAKDPWFSRFV